MDEQQFEKGVDAEIREYAQAQVARADAMLELALLYGSGGRLMDEQQREQVAAELVARIREATERLQPWHQFQHDLRQDMRQARDQAIAELGVDPAPPRPRAPKVAGVTARCGRCSRSLGHHAPALAILERVDGPRSWVIHQVTTRGRDFAHENSPRAEHRIVQSTEGEPVVTGERRLRRPDGIQLACRRCRYKPRRKFADLRREADQAVAKGRDYFYVED